MITVLSPGLLTTVQDLGRPGYAHLGVSASGAADALALRTGNLLLGNPENTPALEMTIQGGEFQFHQDALIALTGSDFGRETWRAISVHAGEIIKLGPTRTGARCYLCIRGGIAAPLTLGSASVHLLTGLGGGRLHRGDSLTIGPEPPRPPLDRLIEWPWQNTGPIRVTAGPQAGWFCQPLDHRTYTVKEDSNRMGLRLAGPTFESTRELLTEGASPGAIQIPPSGEPIILFVEHGTTGGYPKLANVISADLWRLGQLRPRDKVRFQTIPISNALTLLREQEEWLRALVS